VAEAARAWGDGVGKTRPHEIAALSYEMGVVVCRNDDEVVRFGDIPADLAWDRHRGIEVNVGQVAAERAALATDDEVSEFLRSIAEDATAAVLPPTVSRSITYAADHTTERETGLEFLKAVREMQARCTCTPHSDITDCPNYVEGDEDDGGE
jgi:hypothetical protein